MKRFLFLTISGMLGLTLGAFAQSSSPAPDQVMGRGRGGAPYAWNDKDKDGICDITGKPVGQWRPAGFARGAGPGRGARAGRCWRGMARGISAPSAETAQGAPSQPQK